MESGYSKFKNPYHNLIHAADVLQTTYQIVYSAGLMVEVNAVCLSFFSPYHRLSEESKKANDVAYFALCITIFKIRSVVLPCSFFSTYQIR